MAKVEDVLDAARGELGYAALEDPEPGSKYGRWMAAVTGEDWLAGPSREIWWCCMFVSWCLAAAGQECPGFPSYNTDLVLAANPPRVPTHDMRPGDIVVWNWDGDRATDHIGIVESYEGGKLVTIEGNYRNTVARVDRTSSMPQVAAVIRPPYGGRGQRDLRRGIDIFNGEGEAGMRGDETAAAFVICKASEGTGFADPYAAKFAENVVAAGKLLGFYHYALPGDAEAQAEHFVACCKATGHLAEATLWLDYEAEALANGPAWAERFMARVDAMTGKTCGVYMSQGVTLTQDWAASSHRPLWAAQYLGTHDEGPVTGWQDDPWTVGVFGAWGASCAIHQYTGRGLVPGWSGYLDLDRGYFTADQWAAWAGGEKPAPSGIEEDGYWGRETTAAAQRRYGTPEDGEVWHQWPSTAQPGCTDGWRYDRTGKGSALILAMQRDLAARGLYSGPLDGLAGPMFWKAFQTDMGTPADGEIWAPSPAVAEFQRRLNEEV